MSKIPYFSSEKIADGSYIIKNAFCPQSPAFAYLIVGQDYALVIDTIVGCGDLRSFCQTLTEKPLKLVNTHVHPDHTGGNYHFDSCYIHYRDICYLFTQDQHKKEAFFEFAKTLALPEYRDQIELDDNFRDMCNIEVFPLNNGDIFDLGDRKIDVVYAGGHTPGSIVLIDHKTRIAYSGDACNSNTLLECANSLPIAEYLDTLIRLKERIPEFDKMYGGHEIFEPSIIDEGIETVRKVLDGTDDKFETTGMFGYNVFYAAKRGDDYQRVDGKKFNMSYIPSKLTDPVTDHQVITLDPPKMI